MDEILNILPTHTVSSNITTTSSIGEWSSTSISNVHPSYITTTYINSSQENSDIAELKADIAELKSQIAAMNKHTAAIKSLSQPEHRKLDIP